MLTDTILALFIAFFACAALCPIMIPILHRMKFGQQVRDDGPQSHLKKSGTPTMGGIMIVLAIALGCRFSKRRRRPCRSWGLRSRSGLSAFSMTF